MLRHCKRIPICFLVSVLACMVLLGGCEKKDAQPDSHFNIQNHGIISP